MYGIEKCTEKDTPPPAGFEAKPEKPDPVAANFPCPETIGEHLWPIRCTRLDLEYKIDKHYVHMRFWDSVRRSMF